MIVQSKTLGRLTAAWLLLAASAAGAEPLTLDRLLKVEDLGATALSPDGRHLVVETRAPYDTAPSFDFDSPDARLGRLMVADLATTARARPLIVPEAGAGYTAGPFSPNGRWMIVSRWLDYRWTAGVVEIATGKVRWLPFGLQGTEYGRSLQWVSDSAFVALALAPDDPPLKLDLGWRNQRRLTALWARQVAGQVASLDIVGSGRARRPEPRQDRRLVRVDLATGVQSVLATGGFFDLEVSPSRRYVALLGEAERVGLVQTPAVRMMAPARRRALSIVDLKTGAIQAPCPACTTLIEPMVWAPEADRLLVYQHPVDQLETAGQLIVVDAARRTARPVAKALSPDLDYGSEGAARVRAEWRGDNPILLAKSGTAGRSDWYDVAGEVPVDLTGSLPAQPVSLAFEGSSLLALAGGQVFRLGESGRPARLGATGTAWFRRPAFGTGVRVGARAWRDDHLLLRGPAGLADLDGHVDAVPAGVTPLVKTTAGVVVEERLPSGVETIALFSTGGARRDLLTVNGDLAKLDTGIVRTVESRASDGRMLKSWVYLPATWRPGQKPPLIVVPYPGSAPQTYPSRFGLGSNNLMPNPPLLAAQGYAVLIPALPHDRSLGEPAQGLARDILSVVDTVVAQGLADPDRLALWGHSFGGYAALATATQTGRFKAIVAHAGPSDFIANWASLDPHFLTSPEDGNPSPNFIGFNETGQAALNGPPWVENERYLRNSPLLQADKITTPMMLIYGEQDFVTLPQGQAMFAALYRQDKDATLITLFGERHFAASPANVRAVYAEVLPWLADRLNAPPSSAKTAPARPSQ